MFFFLEKQGCGGAGATADCRAQSRTILLADANEDVRRHAQAPAARLTANMGSTILPLLKTEDEAASPAITVSMTFFAF
jgi:hypothetical protein